jgi:hypothetical protein
MRGKAGKSSRPRYTNIDLLLIFPTDQMKGMASNRSIPTYVLEGLGKAMSRQSATHRQETQDRGHRRATLRVCVRTRSSLRDLNGLSHLAQHCRAGLSWFAPHGAGFSQNAFHPIIAKGVLTQTRCGAGFSQSSFHSIIAQTSSQHRLVTPWNCDYQSDVYSKPHSPYYPVVVWQFWGRAAEAS